MTTTKKTSEDKKFNPHDWIIQIKGKDYLPVAARLVWFREEHPDWTIRTEIIENTDNYSVMRAVISNPDRVIATAHKREDKAGFPDYMEKAETGAIGRALAMSGYGTQFAPEFEEGERLADSPISKKEEEKRPLGREGKATLPQLGKIQALYREKGLTPNDMKKILEEMFKVAQPKELSVSDASSCIKYLEMLPEDTVTTDLDGELPLVQ